jgi:hypothetical protein
MFDFLKNIFEDKQTNQNTQTLEELINEVYDIGSGMGEYVAFEMTEKEKILKGKEMLSRIDTIEVKSIKHKSDELYYALAIAYRNYSSWYQKGDNRKKYLVKSVFLLEKTSNEYTEGHAELGRLLIEKKLIRDLSRGYNILKKLNDKNILPSYLNSTLSKANRQLGNIKVKEEYSLCQFINDPSPAVFREERKRFRALIRQYKKEGKFKKIKKVLENYYNFGILVSLCYTGKDCRSGHYDRAKKIVEENCNKINDSYKKSGRIDTDFISDNDWKYFEKYS